jgi:hypothetical protein
MGLADMMSPGESKLPMPLKADGKEEGTPQLESKSKVFPPARNGCCLAKAAVTSSLVLATLFSLSLLVHAFIVCNMSTVVFSFPTPFMVWV